MAKSYIKSTAKQAVKQVKGAATNSGPTMTKKQWKPFAPWHERDERVQQFIDMLRCQDEVTVGELCLIEPMDGLTLLRLVSKLEQTDIANALLRWQSAGGKKTAVVNKKRVRDDHQKICETARKLLKDGIPSHKLTGILAERSDLSRQRIAVVLNASGIKKMKGR
ncbi:hypothetical protein [Dyella caseinilytica]|uniref:Uncharacterized protein n=1 Tax=Dyella caseinilytica TaxID=1849581 RepID=A0ABX7GYD5_9GAMM|nr:hypothetical protein [Dyella caseinilytica]QRN55304.1 hypothetical protein ISN74_08255 [Dyella caseinilytica]GGA00846.1 hypothetical protein GCM10011408_22300 [Dyella caseinilytica]